MSTTEHRPAAVEAPALDSTELYFNRELSWLDFNERVLELAEDEQTPLLERAKFLAIHTSNLEPDDPGLKDRRKAVQEQIDAIDERLAELGYSAK